MTGRQRIVEAYRQVRLPRGSILLVPPPMPEMIDAILDAQFPKEHSGR